MEVHVMVHMANQIAMNFASYSREEAIERTTKHLKSYWAPRMLKQLHAYIGDGGSELHELVKEAEKRLK